MKIGAKYWVGAVALAAFLSIGCSGDDDDASASGGGGGSGGSSGAAGVGGASGQAGSDGGLDARDDAADADTQCPIDVQPSPGVVITDRGAVQGVQDGSVWSYLGIPYVAPPTDDLRWRPPAEHACWTGVFDASALGPKCPQLDAKTGDIIGQEDCLHVNVWAPESGSSTSPLPVVVFVHGGANIQGSTSEVLAANNLIYDGRRLAEGGPAVVVTLNYRLGPFGFLTLPELADESSHGVSGNYGILDQIAALQWVRRNIAAFGGDPDQVFLFGESAGAVNTCVHLASPLSSGLFHAALMQSGGCWQPLYADTEAAMSARVDKESSCASDGDRLACLRAQSVQELLEEIPGSTQVFSTNLGGDPAAYAPVVDGYVLDARPLDALAAGTHNHVPIVVGSNSEEMATRLSAKVDTEAEYDALVTSMFIAVGQTWVDTILATYPASAYATPQDALIALLSDLRFTCPARTTARAAASGQQEPVYRYFFTRRAKTATGTTAASHGIELLYVFGTLHDIPLYTPAQEDADLSTSMIGYWTRFGAMGDPNGGGDPTWPTYDVATDSHLVLDSPPAAGTALLQTQCDMWDSLLATLM